MRTATLIVTMAALASATACNRDDARVGAEAPPQTEAAHTHDDPAQSPTSAHDHDHPAEAPTAGHAAHSSHVTNEPANHADHALGAVETDSTLAPGEYDPSEVVNQPTATIGDLTTCPVSGDVFLVTEDSAYLDRHGERLFFSSPANVRRFQRGPDSYLVAASGAPDGPIVEIEVGGSRFDPPVSKDRIPAGNWICDMGTVHYASPDQGDGSCPVCGMFLVEH